jgi:hypothetical protein
MIAPLPFRLGLLTLAAVVAVSAAGAAQSAPETYTGTASVKTAGGASATAPITVTINSWTPDAERNELIEALKSGGDAGLHKKVSGMKPRATVTLGKSTLDAAYAYAMPSSVGRLITVVTSKPMFFLGGGAPDAKPTAGHDFGVVTLEVDENGSGKGTVTPAANLEMSDAGALIVEDYSVELVTVSAVKKK